MERIDWFNNQSEIFQQMYMKESVRRETGEMGKNIMMPIIAITAAPIVAGELLALSSTSSLFESTQIAEYKFAAQMETAFYNGAERIVLRNSAGQFIKGTGAIVPILEASETAYFTRIGISGLGAASSAYSIPIVEGSITSLAPIWKMVGVGGLSAGVIYLYSKKEQEKIHNP